MQYYLYIFLIRKLHCVLSTLKLPTTGSHIKFKPFIMYEIYFLGADGCFGISVNCWEFIGGFFRPCRTLEHFMARTLAWYDIHVEHGTVQACGMMFWHGLARSFGMHALLLHHASDTA